MYDDSGTLPECRDRVPQQHLAEQYGTARRGATGCRAARR